MVQWPRLCTPKVGDPGSIPDQGTRSHMSLILQLKILHAAVKTQCSQINKYLFKKKRKKNEEGKHRPGNQVACSGSAVSCDYVTLIDEVWFFYL